MAMDVLSSADDRQRAETAPAAATAQPGKTAWRTATKPPPVLSMVIAAKNEAACIGSLLEEIIAALKDQPAAEIIVVDDGSTDDMVAVLRKIAIKEPRLAIIRHKQSCGQSAGLRTGILAATGELIITLDGDGQNDPADIPAMIAAYRAAHPTGVRMVAGQRVKRRDTWVKRASSKFANAVRSRLLKDSTPDTGCGLKVFDRETFLRLPYFDHMHRFLPALVQREGHLVINAPVNHRERSAGVSKYGTWDRLWVGIFDLYGVAWLRSRSKRPEIVE